VTALHQITGVADVEKVPRALRRLRFESAGALLIRSRLYDFGG